MIDHVFLARDSILLVIPARGAVWMFFVLSACVLARSWNGEYAIFLVRRFLRLWPIYALCLYVSSLLSAIPVTAWQLVFIPWPDVPTADRPVWSLIIEMAGMLAMPVFVWVGRMSLVRLVIALVSTFLFSLLVYPYAFFALFFFAGAWLSRFEFRWSPLESRVPQWLGRISYPLYLCHVPILNFLGLPLWASIPLAFGVAVVMTETLEKWSVMASRAAPAYLSGLFPARPAIVGELASAAVARLRFFTPSAAKPRVIPPLDPKP
jgi:peptidoglycan/LPS O-acetylase OafA/YrhL